MKEARILGSRGKAFLLAAWWAIAVASAPWARAAERPPYRDGRPAATLRMDAKDHGIVLRYGDGPDRCDCLGAREAIVFQSGDTYYLHYDGAGPRGWLACLATSKDLVHWAKKGPILDFGNPGEPDSACACSPWVYFDGKLWHMFYVATPLATPPPERIPAVPYLTCKATSRSPGGPWVKQKDLVPFRPKPGTYYADTANSGYVVKHGDEYLMFFSAAAFSGDAARVLKRTLGIARTKNLDGPWQVDPQPVVPPEEQVENSSLYFEPANQTWFLFTNHIGIDSRGEYTDAVWVYWSKDLNRWDPQRKAVVLDYRNCAWSKDCVGMPGVVPVGRRLALLYDGPGGKSVSHMRRNIGLAWLDLPLAPPGSTSAAAEAGTAERRRESNSKPSIGAKMVGMYVHQHWPYNHPYAARTWTLDDWRGYADGLHKLGYNTIMIWPMLETMPDPLTPSDRAYLDKTAKVIDMLHGEYGMRIWLALCPNVGVDDREAAKATIEKRHFFYCDTRVNPADPAAMRQMLARRERLLRPLAKADAISIIDSDPGGYPGSTNAEFVSLLGEHRKLFDRLRPGIELVYWMHVGWEGYARFYQTGKFSWGTEKEHVDALTRLKALDPEPWSIANGLVHAKKLGLQSRVVSFSYGRIEGEPSFPMTNFGGDVAYQGGKDATERGLMGNAQTHCVQLPNTFAFARGAAGLPLGDQDYVRFADDLIPGQGELIVQAWRALAGSDVAAMQELAHRLEALPDAKLIPGRRKGLLFGSPRRFITDLVMQLRVRAGFETFRSAAAANRDLHEPLRQFVAAVEVWQRQHGYENAWWWPGLNESLRKLDSPEVNAVLNTQFHLDSAPPPDWRDTPYEFTHKMLRDTESYTPRLIKAMRQAL